MKKYSISRLNKVATVGHMDNTYNSEGVPQDTFVADLTIFYGSYSRGVDRTLSLTGTALEDTTVIAVRHDDRLTNKQRIQLADGVTYYIQSIEADDDINAFDTLTLTLKKGRG